MGVRAYLVGQVGTVVMTDRALRTEALGAVEAVHDARVAVRRVRSVLRVFPELSEDDVAGRLAVWSDRLGAVREAQVLEQTLRSACPTQLWDAVAPLAATERAAALSELGEDLLSAEHRRLLDDLEALALRPKSGRLHKRRRIGRAVRAAARRLGAAAEEPELLHRARKAAKRARYAAEAVGDHATAERWEAVQDALGEHHDCIVALLWLGDVPGDVSGDVPGDEAARARRALRERASAALAGLDR
jgi:CHAD domain-containing protein